MRRKLVIRKQSLILFPIIFLLCCQHYEEVNFLYLLDSTGLKHIFLVLFIAFTIIGGKHRLKLSEAYELKRIYFVACVLALITLVFIIINGFSINWLSELYFLLIPITFVVCVFKNNWNLDAVKEFADFFLASLLVCFILLTVTRIRSGIDLKFSYIYSTSPFEIESAHLFLLLYIFYTYVNDRKKRIVSAILCVLSWKRVALLYLIFVAVFHKKVPKNRNVRKSFYFTATVIAVFIPLLFKFILSDVFENWFVSVTGLNLHKFMMFRYETIYTAFNNDIPNKGLGTFLLVDVPWYGDFVRVSIHNDIIRLYLEVTVIGLACFIYGYSSLCKSYYAFITMVYMFLELTVSHFLGNGSLPFWILALAMICFFNRGNENNTSNFSGKGYLK